MDSSDSFKRNFVPIIAISFGIVLPFCHAGCCVSDKCRRILFNEPIRDKAITGHLIRTVESPNPGTCQVKCYNEPNCVSINVGPLDGGRHKCELNNDTAENQASSFLQTKMDYTFFGIENPCSSSPCFNDGTCQVGYTAKGFRCKCPPGFTGELCSKACSFDFEDGIGGWEKTGTAFDNQPTFGDNSKARNRETANQQGDWWIGGAEVRPSPNDPVGRNQGDIALGTLTSPCFLIVGQNISFLIGGGCDATYVRAELIVNNKVVERFDDFGGSYTKRPVPRSVEGETITKVYYKVTREIPQIITGERGRGARLLSGTILGYFPMDFELPVSIKVAHAHYRDTDPLTTPLTFIKGKGAGKFVGPLSKQSLIPVKAVVVRTEVGNCWETMYRKSWDVQDLIGQHACVRLIDNSPGDGQPWAHINFDDLKGDIICPPD